MSINYRPHPPWHVEEERKLVGGEAKAYQELNYYRESFYFILDGNNQIVAMIADARDAELIVELANSFFSSCKELEP